MLTNMGTSGLSSPLGCGQSQVSLDLDFSDLEWFDFEFLDFHPSSNLEPFDLLSFDLATSQSIGTGNEQHDHPITTSNQVSDISTDHIENAELPGDPNSIHQPGRMSRMQKRKAPAIEDEDWGRVKSRLIGLYSIENRPLREVRDTIRQEFGFEATYVTP